MSPGPCWSLRISARALMKTCLLPSTSSPPRFQVEHKGGDTAGPWVGKGGDRGGKEKGPGGQSARLGLRPVGAEQTAAHPQGEAGCLRGPSPRPTPSLKAGFPRPLRSALPGRRGLTSISWSDVSTLKGRMLSSSLPGGRAPGPHHPSSSGSVSALSRETNQ